MNEQEYPLGKPKFDLKVWKKLLPFLSPYKAKMFAVLIVMLLVSAGDIAIPLFQSYAVNHFIVPQSTAGLAGFSGTYLLMAAAQCFGVIMFSRLCMRIEMLLGRDLRRTAFIHLQKLSFSYYNKTPVGYILARVMSDSNRIAGLIAWSFIDLFWGLFYVLGVFVAMLILNWKLALLVIAVVPPVAVLTAVFKGRILVVNRKVRHINSRITGAYNEGITGAKTSKTLVIEDKNCREFADLTGEMYRNSLYATRLNALFVPIVLFFGSLAAAAVLARGGYLVMGSVLNYGILSAFISYALGILEPIQQMAGVFADFLATQVNIERVTSLLETPCDVRDMPEVETVYGDCFHPKTENWPPIKGEIEFKDVTFHYPDGEENVLEHFNLRVPAGTTVAIVGETGAGKSTLVNLACRFFEPTEGQILIDGVDYRERSQLWLHSNLGYVLQNPHLFSGTVRDNIRYGRLDATDAEIEQAASLVSADMVVHKLEKGYDTDVGEGGDRLSTGEKQLISFARAVIADPPIFVLDEATSSVDTETEALIQNAVSHILKNRTSFIIAHRLSTVRHADLILVVRDGKIIERGTHDELLTQEGYYQSLYTAMRIEDAAGSAEPFPEAR
ncbi:MAG: ABC transporter ATP-binding protein [Clostridiaceae bacterium]|nr:ABC transporter ATP-binding protein [Clostridiaceae bacterium]